MCAAHDDMDDIHEAEVAAHQRVEETEKRAKEIKEEADAESCKILQSAELLAKEKAKAIVAEIEAKKKEIDERVQNETDLALAHVKTTSKEWTTEAVKAALKILLAEE